jgi:hypothetical protein
MTREVVAVEILGSLGLMVCSGEEEEVVVEAAL